MKAQVLRNAVKCQGAPLRLKAWKKGISNLALKPRQISPKQEYHWSHKKDMFPLKIKKKISAWDSAVTTLSFFV